MTINLSAIPTTIDALHAALTVLSLLLFALLFLKRANNATATGSVDIPANVESAKPAAAVAPAPAPALRPAQLKETGPEAALQLLALLQQDARFIDFIQEDLSGFSDADIGAAARVVHEGSKKTLSTYFQLSPIRSEEEESRISLPAGFNAAETRLTGNVVGEAPFNGTLIHKGWRVTETRLPKISDGHDSSIVAPAEVEL